MITKRIEHENFEGEKVTTVAQFHLTKFEWLELETYTKGGFIQNLKDSLEVEDWKKTINLMTKLIIKAYGQKDAETGKWVKDDAAAEVFLKTEAFSSLFDELSNNQEASQAFFLELIPKEYQEKAKSELAKQNAALNVVQ